VTVPIRVATYNLHGLRDDVAALTRVIAALHADVLCVQEALRFGRWRARRAALAASAGLTVATHGRVGGVAVLTGPRVRVLHAEHHALRAFRGLERRALAVAVVEPVRGDGGGARLAVGSFHLDLDQTARTCHVAEITALMEDVAARHGASIVLGGDLNEQDHQPAPRPPREAVPPSPRTARTCGSTRCSPRATLRSSRAPCPRPAPTRCGPVTMSRSWRS
jgi:endonuclease/exonuclease/phosphatase family metal-dependent hydrolase